MNVHHALCMTTLAGAASSSGTTGCMKEQPLQANHTSPLCANKLNYDITNLMPNVKPSHLILEQFIRLSEC
jgi:hypothetical protein